MKETILSLEKGAMERWRNGDPWGFVEISAEDVTYVDPGLTTPILGLEEFKAYMKQLEGKIRYQGSEFIDPRVIVAGDAAVLSYKPSGMRRRCTFGGTISGESLIPIGPMSCTNSPRA
jgi:hypothetical protein